MTATARLFVPNAATPGTSLPGHAVGRTHAGEMVLFDAGPQASVTGVVREITLDDLDRRVQRAGPDVAIAVVVLVDGERALALRATSPPAKRLARTWDHTSLAVRDLDQAIRFYHDVFGFEVTFEQRGMREQIQRITGLAGISCDLAQLRAAASRHTLELIAFHGVAPARSTHAPTTPGAGHIAFAVQDLERALALISAHGGRILGEVTQFEAGPGLYCRDPSGTFLELDQL